MLTSAQKDYKQSDEEKIVTRQSTEYARNQGMKSHTA